MRQFRIPGFGFRWFGDTHRVCERGSKHPTRASPRTYPKPHTPYLQDIGLLRGPYDTTLQTLPTAPDPYTLKLNVTLRKDPVFPEHHASRIHFKRPNKKQVLLHHGKHLSWDSGFRLVCM